MHVDLSDWMGVRVFGAGQRIYRGKWAMASAKAPRSLGGVAGREAGFSASLLAKAGAASVEMTKFGWVGERHSGRFALPSEMRGFFAALRMTT